MKYSHLLLAKTEFNTDRYVTLFDDVLIIDSDRLPDASVIEWKQYFIVGGVFWKKVPNLAVRRANYLVLYRDTLMSLITWPLRWYLIPGCRPWTQLRRRIRRNSHVNESTYRGTEP